jgi:hypothetical protein
MAHKPVQVTGRYAATLVDIKVTGTRWCQQLSKAE